VGDDRLAVGAPPEGRWRRLFGSGFDTCRTGDGELVAETRRNSTGTRYRVEGRPAGAGASQVRFFAIRQTGEMPEERTARDLAAELELVRRLEPDAARSIEATLAAPAR